MTLVLIVDDSGIDRLLAGGILQKQFQCDIAYAEDGASGLESVRALNPDLVVTDMQMPVMNGLELVAKLRQEENQTPVILMTATGSEDLAVDALRVGASSYVPKRCLASQLADTVRMVLSIANDDREQGILMGRLHSYSELFRLHNRTEECRSLSRYSQSTLARIWNLKLTARLRIGLAVEEALLNALYHGNLEVSSCLKDLPDNSFHKLAVQRQNESPYNDRQIEVALSISPHEMCIVISDGGPGFDVSKLPDPTDPENMTRPYGRGVMLMNAFMDDVRFNSSGNQVTLIKKRAKMNGDSDYATGR